MEPSGAPVELAVENEAPAAPIAAAHDPALDAAPPPPAGAATGAPLAPAPPPATYAAAEVAVIEPLTSERPQQAAAAEREQPVAISTDANFESAAVAAPSAVVAAPAAPAAEQPAIVQPALPHAAAAPAMVDDPAPAPAADRAAEAAAAVQPAPQQAAQPSEPTPASSVGNHAAAAAAAAPPAAQAAQQAAPTITAEPAADSAPGPYQHALPQAPAGAAPAASAPATAAPAPNAPDADFEQAPGPEEKHAQKPTWRRGYTTYGKTDYLLVTLTPSDCSTRRLRPPREWYDGMLGASNLNFVVGAQAPDGSSVSFLCKAHGYEYVKAEYYVQGGETKRMFKVLGLQPGDALKLALAGKSSGIPTTRLTIVPAARNPHAAAILASAADQAAKREARLAANPKGPKVPGGASAPRKRKKKEGEEETDDEGFEGDPGEGCAAGRRIRQRARKQFGDDFVSGLDEAWAAAQHSDDEYQSDYEDQSGGGSRQRRRAGGSRSAAASSGPGWYAAAAAAASGGTEQQQSGSAGLAGGGMPEVVATGVAEGRNVLRIKINRPPPAPAPAAPAPAAAGGKRDEAAGPAAAPGAGGAGEARRGSDPGCPLNFLAGLADGTGTPLGDQGRAAPPGAAGAAGSAEAGGTAEPVMLLSKKLLRDEGGAVTGVKCKLGWEQGSRSPIAISRALSKFGVSHHDSAAVETFEVHPEQCLLELTLRLHQAGRQDVLEKAIVQLLDAL